MTKWVGSYIWVSFFLPSEASAVGRNFHCPPNFGIRIPRQYISVKWSMKRGRTVPGQVFSPVFSSIAFGHPLGHQRHLQFNNPGNTNQLLSVIHSHVYFRQNCHRKSGITVVPIDFAQGVLFISATSFLSCVMIDKIDIN